MPGTNESGMHGARTEHAARTSRGARTWRLTLALAVISALQLGASVFAQPPHTTTRLTYYASSATFAGTLQGATTSTADAATPAGHGYTQVDIVYSDDQVCVGALTIYTRDLLTDALTTLTTAGFVTPGDACADYWVAPAKLAQEPPPTQGLTVTRGQQQLRNGTSVDFVRHRNESSSATTQLTYEAATGYLLIGTHETPNGTSQNYSELVNVRQYQLPTASAVLPDHVRGVKELVYECVSGTRLGSAVSELACETRFTVDSAGPQWLALKAVTRLHNHVVGITDTSEGSAVVTMAVSTGLFVAPEVLRGLRPDQQVDFDPITNTTTVVQSVTDRAVTIVIRGGAENFWLVYDLASGWMAESYQEKMLGQGSTYVRMRLTSVN